MGVKRIIVALVFLFACGGKGTEVVSPPNPNEGTDRKKIENGLYEITMNLPAGWTYQEVGPGVTPGPETFKDSDPDTITVAQFNKGVSGFFTVFFSTLSSGEPLEAFIRRRRPSGEIQIQLVPEEKEAYLAFFLGQREPGPHGGFVADVYASVKRQVLWVRAEAVGTTSEQEKILNEFFQVIVPSIRFKSKV